MRSPVRIGLKDILLWFGGSRLFRRWPDGQHGAGGGAHYALRDAADDQMAETGPTMRRRHDEVHVFRLRRLDELWSASDSLRLATP